MFRPPATALAGDAGHARRIALLGVVTATLASWLVQKVGDHDEANPAATRHQVAALTAQIEAL